MGGSFSWGYRILCGTERHPRLMQATIMPHAQQAKPNHKFVAVSKLSLYATCKFYALSEERLFVLRTAFWVLLLFFTERHFKISQR
jgi:hypothetical protein